MGNTNTTQADNAWQAKKANMALAALTEVQDAEEKERALIKMIGQTRYDLVCALEEKVARCRVALAKIDAENDRILEENTEWGCMALMETSRVKFALLDTLRQTISTIYHMTSPVTYDMFRPAQLRQLNLQAV